MVSVGIKKTREMVQKTKRKTNRLYNNINTKSIKNVEEKAKAITPLTTQNRVLKEVILT